MISTTSSSIDIIYKYCSQFSDWEDIFSFNLDRNGGLTINNLLDRTITLTYYSFSWFKLGGLFIIRRGSATQPYDCGNTPTSFTLVGTIENINGHPSTLTSNEKTIFVHSIYNGDDGC